MVEPTADAASWILLDFGFLSSSTATSTNASTKHVPSTVSPEECVVYANFDHDVPLLVVCLLCMVAGFLYSFFGYRFFKASLFLTGFLLGSVLIYMVCEKEALLPKLGNAGVGVIAGLLFGLITMLVQYVGLFVIGFGTGLLYGVIVLVVWTFVTVPETLWITIGVLFGVGLLFALLTLKFQRAMLIICTSTIGGALIVQSLDYIVERFSASKLFWHTLNVVDPVEWRNLCWYGWLIVAAWPVLLAAGCLIQWRLTARGFRHKESCRNSRRRPSSDSVIICRPSTVTLSKDRSKRMDSSTTNLTSTKVESQGNTPPTKGYRYLYQTRRMHGDIICQSYIESLQRLSQKQMVVNNETPTLGSDQTHLTMLTTDSNRTHFYDHGSM